MSTQRSENSVKTRGAAAEPAVRGGAAAPRHDPDLRDLLRVVAAGRWQIIGLAALGLALGAAYVLETPPVYRATALVQLEDRALPPAATDRLAPLLELRSPVAGEIELMRSQAALNRVVEDLRLDVSAEPVRVPLLGRAVARFHRGREPAPPPLARLAGWAWGGERIALGRLEVTGELLDEQLRLTALGGGRYALADPGGAPILQGAVGVLASAARGGGRVELLVTELSARPGTAFRVARHPREDVVGGLAKNLRVEERGRDSGVVSLELEGTDPSPTAQALFQLAADYLRQNAERRSAQAARTLAALEAQLPSVRARVHAAEAALETYRVRAGTVDLIAEAADTARRVGDLDREIQRQEGDRWQLAQRYAADHPDLVALDRRLAALRAERAKVEPRVRALPGTELEATRLTRELSVASELYTALLGQVQALRVARDGAAGNARLVDRPVVPRHPERPRPGIALGLGGLLGVVAGIALTLVRAGLREDDGGRAPGVRAGLPVLAVVPQSAPERRLASRAGPREALARAAPGDVATECLRQLRTAVTVALREGRVLAVTSATPGAGKSFVAANLAHLFAAAGRRAVLVDGDLRRGELHRHLGVPASPGLADVLEGLAPLDDALRPTRVPGLSVLACGALPEHAADLLAGPRLREVMSELARRHDVVVVDTPPVLAVTDAALLAAGAEVTLLVARARGDDAGELERAVERLAQGGVAVHGLVLNGALAADGAYAVVYEHRSVAAERALADRTSRLAPPAAPAAQAAAMGAMPNAEPPRTGGKGANGANGRVMPG